MLKMFYNLSKNTNQDQSIAIIMQTSQWCFFSRYNVLNSFQKSQFNSSLDLHYIYTVEVF